jgi:hypothetical protein
MKNKSKQNTITPARFPKPCRCFLSIPTRSKKDLAG